MRSDRWIPPLFNDDVCFSRSNGLSADSVVTAFLRSSGGFPESRYRPSRCRRQSPGRSASRRCDPAAGYRRCSTTTFASVDQTDCRLIAWWRRSSGAQAASPNLDIAHRDAGGNPRVVVPGPGILAGGQHPPRRNHEPQRMLDDWRHVTIAPHRFVAVLDRLHGALPTLRRTQARPARNRIQHRQYRAANALSRSMG